MPNTNVKDTTGEGFSVPVLFVIFNRPDTAQKVFDEIRKAQPKYLYVAADGPREGNEKDERLCRESRAIIGQVDWPCEVKTLFRDKNLGCKMGVSSAISWFFENVEAGIILEDDCVPHQSFFRFAGDMLEKYKDEERVMMVTGLNPVNTYKTSTSYYFSRHFSIWGWATWRRAWQKYDIDMREWPRVKVEGLEKYYPDPYARSSMEEAFEKTYLGKIDTWDAQWALTGLVHDGLCIVPARNLISNIGLYGVHFSGEASFHQNLPTFDIYQQTLVHPVRIKENATYDSTLYKKTFHPKFKLSNKIRSFLARSKTLKRLYHWIKRVTAD
ncbi:MAG: hypothetical protein ACYC4I_00025 [Minisyncoccota bacterium]